MLVCGSLSVFNHGECVVIRYRAAWVLPITSLGLNHNISTERIATGIPRLDAMLGGRGFFRGSSILLTGTSGTTGACQPGSTLASGFGFYQTNGINGARNGQIVARIRF